MSASLTPAGPAVTRPVGTARPAAVTHRRAARRPPVHGRCRLGRGDDAPGRRARGPRTRPRSGGDLRRRARRWLWRRRAPLVATCCGLALALVVAELKPPSPEVLAVVVAARDLPAGTTLDAADLRVTHLAPAAAPDDVPATVDEHVGRRLLVAVPAGLPLARSLVHSGGLAATAPPGTVVTTVGLADPAAAAVLTTGDRVDVFAAGTGADGQPEVVVLARRAIVLDPGAPPGAGGGLLVAPPPAGLTVLAVGPDEAATIAGFVGRAAISAVLVP